MSKRIKVKPGKTQSKIGFIISIGFVVIGCILVIPTFGLFGIFWTGVAGFIAYSNFKNGFSDEGIVTHEIVVEDDNDSIYERDNSSNSIENKLKELESLYNQGLISHDEFTAKRKEILDRF